jgi:hypothetical protein
MNNNVTFSQVFDALEKNGQTCATLTLQNDVTVVISERGGRILGPFLTPDSGSIFWLNRAFANTASFADFLDSGDWNLGGERIWIGPEIQYSVRDRSDFWGSIQTPKQIDPGQYVLDQPKPDQWRLSQEISLEAFNLATGRKTLQIERLIRPIEDPLRFLDDYPGLLDGITFAGYEQVVTLSESSLDDIKSESWNLVQLNPGGQLFIPASPHVKATDYFEPIDATFQSIQPNHLSLKITGDRRYKVGYKAVHLFGRLAYFNRLENGLAYLIVRSFFNNPAVPYAEEPPGEPGQRGHSVHVYNDDGQLGGFGELECNGQTIGGETGWSASTDHFGLWLYVGPPEQIKNLVPHLLGIKL